MYMTFTTGTMKNEHTKCINVNDGMNDKKF